MKNRKIFLFLLLILMFFIYNYVKDLDTTKTSNVELDKFETLEEIRKKETSKTQEDISNGNFEGMVDIKGKIYKTVRGYTLYGWKLEGNFNFQDYLNKEVIVRVKKGDHRNFLVCGIIEWHNYEKSKNIIPLAREEKEIFSLISDPINNDVDEPLKKLELLTESDFNFDLNSEVNDYFILEGFLTKENDKYYVLGHELKGDVEFDDFLLTEVFIEGNLDTTDSSVTIYNLSTKK